MPIIEAPRFNPRRISDLSLWLSSRRSPMTLDGSDNVAQWNDLSGNGNHAVQGVGGDQPLFDLTAFNGTPGVIFGVSSAENLEIPNAASLGLSTGDFTIFVMHNATTVNSNFRILLAKGNDANTTLDYVFMLNNDNKMRVVTGNSSVSNVLTTNAISAAINYIHVFDNDLGGTTGTWHQNDVSAGSGVVSSGDLNSLNIGLGSRTTNIQYYEGVIAEIIVYKKSLSAEERAYVTQYLFQMGGFTFNPTDIEGLRLWLDASDEGTITKDGSDKVSQWDDKSGQGNHAIQGTGVNQPLYSSSSMDGLPGIFFDGIAYNMNSYRPTKGSYTMFFVFRTDAVNAVFVSQDALGWNNLDSSIGLGQQNLFIPPDGTFSIETHGPTASIINGVNTTVTYNDDSPHYGTVVIDGTDYKVRVDAANEASTTSTQSGIWGSNGTTDLTLGKIHTSYRKSYQSEIIFYNRALNATEVSQIENYLLNKWNILFSPLNIPGLKLWLDASDLTTITKDGSDKVSQWDDKSGNGLDALQGDGTKKFTYDSTGFNNLPTMIGNGSSTFMSIPNFQLFATNSSPLFVFIVFKTNDNTKRQYLLAQNSAASAQVFLNYELGVKPVSVNGRPGLHQGSGRATVGDTVGVSNSTDTLFSCFVLASGTAPANVTMKVNGVSQTMSLESVGWMSAGSYETDSDRPLNIGARDMTDVSSIDAWLDGNISEILIYNEALSVDEIATIENYLSNKWRILV